MPNITLYRKRQVCLPTIWGWFLFLIISSVVCVLSVQNIYRFLAPNAPVDARILVVEGWLARTELDQAVQAFKMGNYTSVATTGGPTDWPETKYGNFAQMAADYLAQHGVPRELIHVVPAPPSAQERTFLSAVMLRESLAKSGSKIEAINLFSSGAHARRSRLLFRMALGNKVQVGILAAKPDGYDPQAWWRTSTGVESIIFQTIGLIWVKCFFWPGPPGSPQELWSS
jgi:uncharacterized SAM-binding protein YcdF (DUF218 family)